jgi:hypothetical protein
MVHITISDDMVNSIITLRLLSTALIGLKMTGKCLRNYQITIGRAPQRIDLSDTVHMPCDVISA